MAPWTAVPSPRSRMTGSDVDRLRGEPWRDHQPEKMSLENVLLESKKRSVTLNRRSIASSSHHLRALPKLLQELSHLFHGRRILSGPAATPIVLAVGRPTASRRD